MWHHQEIRGRSEWIAATLDGQKQCKWNQEMEDGGWWSGHPVWKNNSEWIAITRRYANNQHSFAKVAVYSTDDPSATLAIDLFDVPDGLLLGLTSQERLMLYHPIVPSTPATAVEFRDIHLARPLASVSDYKITLPEPRQVWSVVLSTHGTHLAWLLVGMQNGLCTLWVSDRQGRDFKGLGQWEATQIEAVEPINQRRYDRPRNLKWMPDGQNVSFIYNRALCTVPTIMGSSG